MFTQKKPDLEKMLAGFVAKAAAEIERSNAHRIEEMRGAARAMVAKIDAFAEQVAALRAEIAIITARLDKIQSGK